MEDWQWAEVPKVEKNILLKKELLSSLLISQFSADLIFQKSAKKRAEAAKMIEKEISAMSARQEKVDHKLKERIGKLSESRQED